MDVTTAIDKSKRAQINGEVPFTIVALTGLKARLDIPLKKKPGNSNNALNALSSTADQDDTVLKLIMSLTENERESAVHIFFAMGWSF
jgi:hypothetical protein